MVVTLSQVTGFSGFSWLGPVLGPLSTAGLVFAMVTFMLMERRQLRDRLIELIGAGQLATTTQAFDEAGSRRRAGIAGNLLVHGLSFRFIRPPDQGNDGDESGEDDSDDGEGVPDQRQVSAHSSLWSRIWSAVPSVRTSSLLT